MGTVEKRQVGLIGRKVGMTQVFNDKGEFVPVTVLQMGPCRVVQKRVKASDGYDALQLGYEEVVKKRGVNKPLAGHYKKADVPPQRVLREVRGMSPEEFEVGQTLKADLFKTGEKVRVRGTSKGRGFAGGVKRHGYSGGKATHGSMFHRAVGSIGAAAYPSRVFRGKRMPGRMGSDRVTVKSLMVVGVDTERDIILIRGTVPGAPSGLVLVTADRD